MTDVSHQKVAYDLPEGHPFRQFIMDMKPDAACDPVPDIIERGTEVRRCAFFHGDNASARAGRFITAIKNGCPTVSILRSHFAGRNANVVIYIHNINNVSVSTDVVAPEEPIAGCISKPTY